MKNDIPHVGTCSLRCSDGSFGENTFEYQECSEPNAFKPGLSVGTAQRSQRRFPGKVFFALLSVMFEVTIRKQFTATRRTFQNKQFKFLNSKSFLLMNIQFSENRKSSDGPNVFSIFFCLKRVQWIRSG